MERKAILWLLQRAHAQANLQEDQDEAARLIVALDAESEDTRADDRAQASGDHAGEKGGDA